MKRPDRNEDKYWAGTRDFNSLVYEQDLENYIDILERENSVVVCNNKAELAYMIAWCKGEGKHVADFMRVRDKFPICLGVTGDIVGYVDAMDRALYYIDFIDFITVQEK